VRVGLKLVVVDEGRVNDVPVVGAGKGVCSAGPGGLEIPRVAGVLRGLDGSRHSEQGGQGRDEKHAGRERKKKKNEVKTNVRAYVYGAINIA
jgi:hypothetical protein